MTHPNLAGFAEAQKRLIQEFGQTVVLLTPTPTTWPPNTKLDPETGRPMDPWVTPVASGYASATASAAVAFRPITSNRAGVEAADIEGPLGVKGSLGAAIVLPEEEWPKASGATRAIVQEKLYLIEDKVKDDMPVRYIIFVEPM